MQHRYALAFIFSCTLHIGLMAQGETCETALAAAPGAITTDGPASGSGASSGDATHADWFIWTAPLDAYITIQSCGTGVDTRLKLHAGDCGTLTLVASDDDGCAGGGSLLANVLVTGGTTYFIEWDDAHSIEGFAWQFYLHACPNIVPDIMPGPGSLTLDWVVDAPGATFTMEYGPTGFEPGTGTIVTGQQGGGQPPVELIGLTAGLEYTFWISVDCGAGNLAPYTGPWLGIPDEVVATGNDDCETAAPITCGGSIAGSTATALLDGAPECGTPVSAAGVWYTFTGVSGAVVLSTCADHGYDTKINVYTGSCDDLDCVDGNDDGAFGCYPGSELAFEADGSTTYRVLVQGYDGAVGDFTLDMLCPACMPPSGIAITPTDTVAYLEWTPADPGVGFTVEYGPAGFSPGTGTVIAGTVGDNDPPVTIPGLDLATDYDAYLIVDCPGGDPGLPRGPIAFTTLEEPLPANAFCGGAVALSCGQQAGGDTQLGVLASAPECGSGFISTPGLWYTFVGDGGDVTVSTCDAAEFDTKISVWSGTCGDLACEGGVDDQAGCGGNTSAVTISTSAGTTYFVLVHGYDGEVGPFTISMSCAPACSPAIINDDCSSAQVIQPQLIGSCVPVQGTLECAYSSATPNPPCDPYSAAFDVWYTFNTGPSPDHTITVALVTADLVGVALYSGCGPGTFIDCYEAQAGPIVLTGLETNADYFVQVWNQGGDAAGTFTLCDEAPVLVSVPENGVADALRAWPVPVEDLLTIDGLPNGSTSLRVCDAQGRVMHAQRVSHSGAQQLDLRALAPGAYVVCVEGSATAAIRILRR